MNICPYCQEHNLIGTLVCAYCHRSLSSFDPLPTRQMLEEPTAVNTPWHGNAVYDPDVRIILYVRGSAEPIVLPTQRCIRIGRAKEGSPTSPDLDLTRYHAFEKGVSAHHAVLERTAAELVLYDVGSKNGTYLNGQKLVPQLPTALRDGDQLQLGGLTIRLYLETTACKQIGT